MEFIDGQSGVLKMKRVTISFILILYMQSCFGNILDPQLLVTKINITVLQTALTSFYLDHNKYPQSTTWKEDVKIYLQDGRIPKDGWDQDLVYINLGFQNEIPFKIYSLGPDKKSKTGGMDPDDICTCKMKKEANGDDGDFDFEFEKPLDPGLFLFIAAIGMCFAIILIPKSYQLNNKTIVCVFKVSRVVIAFLLVLIIIYFLFRSYVFIY